MTEFTPGADIGSICRRKRDDTLIDRTMTKKQATVLR